MRPCSYARAHMQAEGTYVDPVSATLFRPPPHPHPTPPPQQHTREAHQSASCRQSSPQDMRARVGSGRRGGAACSGPSRAGASAGFPSAWAPCPAARTACIVPTKVCPSVTPLFQLRRAQWRAQFVLCRPATHKPTLVLSCLALTRVNANRALSGPGLRPCVPNTVAAHRHKRSGATTQPQRTRIRHNTAQRRRVVLAPTQLPLPPLPRQSAYLSSHHLSEDERPSAHARKGTVRTYYRPSSKAAPEPAGCHLPDSLPGYR